jgi:hypothetical protein
VIATDLVLTLPDKNAHCELKMNELRSDSLVEPSAPAFDDERTVASARPVVPLAKLKTHRRIWLLGGAYALAMILGAGIALLGAYLRVRNTPAATSNSPEVQLSSAPLVAVDSAPSEMPADESTVDGSTEESPVVAEPATEARPRRRTPPRRNSVLSQPRVPEASEDDELRRIRGAVLVEEWQERRARRVLRRERRRAERYNHRDLSNLDEIFEGPRRRP